MTIRGVNVLLGMLALLSISSLVNAEFADETKITASDGVSYDSFGDAVAMDGDTIIVGAADDDDNGTNSGSAYIYEYDTASGSWLQQKLTASDGATYDNFGQSVAISGDTAIIGADGGSAATNITGYAYIFVRNGTTGVWEEQQKLVASDAAIDTYFGYTVAIDGDWAAVTAIGTDFAGSVYMFVRDPSTGVWSEDQIVVSSNNSTFDGFGRSMDIDGNNMIVGAEGDSGNGGAFSGSAYLFVRDPSASTGVFWSEQQRLWDKNGGHQQNFGVSVSLSGDNAIVGANRDDDNNLQSGSAFVYTRDPVSGDWTEQKILPADGAAYDEFGKSVSMLGNTAIIGADGDSDNGFRSGSVYVYQRKASGLWEEQQKLLATGGAKDEHFGISVVVSGDRFVAGSFGDNSYTGSAFVFTNIPTPDITVTDSTAPINDLILAFGEVTEFTSTDQTVTITNDGELDLILGSLATLDTLDFPFTIETDSCSSQTLTPATNCSLGIRFSPTSTGSFSDSVDIPSNDPNEASVSLNITGDGVAPLVPDIAVIDAIAPIDDLIVDFGSYALGWSAGQWVTVKNEGTADLVVGDVALIETVTAPFMIVTDSCSGQTLVPLASCEVGIAFTPSVVGSYSGSFDIPSNDADEASLSVSFLATAIEAQVANITVTDSVVPVDDHMINFGAITHSTSADQLVTVSNDGNVDLNIGTIAAQNVLLSPYSIVADFCSGVAVPPLSSCTFTVLFAPTAVYTYNESFDIPSDDPDQSSVIINLSGVSIATPAPVIAVTDTEAPVNDLAIPFGNVTESISVTETVAISNAGNANLNIGNIATANALAFPFAINTDSCSGQSLAPSSFCSVVVSFTPQAVGNFSDSFDIPSDDPNNSGVTFSLSGVGMALPVADISVSDSVAPANDLQVVFGNVMLSDSSDAQLTVHNNGNTHLNIGNIGDQNALLAPFSIVSDTCSATSLAPAASCVVTLRFGPTVVGNFNDSIDIPSSDVDQQSITITVSGAGTGLPVPNVSITDHQLLFGNVTQQTSAELSVTLSNTGSADLTIGNVAQLNTLQTPFAMVSDPCSGNTLAPTQSCVLRLSFSPVSTGSFTDSFDVPSDDPDSPTVVISLSGVGIESSPGNTDRGNSGGGSLGLLPLLIALLGAGLRRRSLFSTP